MRILDGSKYYNQNGESMSKFYKIKLVKLMELNSIIQRILDENAPIIDIFDTNERELMPKEEIMDFFEYNEDEYSEMMQ